MLEENNIYFPSGDIWSQIKEIEEAEKNGGSGTGSHENNSAGTSPQLKDQKEPKSEKTPDNKNQGNAQDSQGQVDSNKEDVIVDAELDLGKILNDQENKGEDGDGEGDGEDGNPTDPNEPKESISSFKAVNKLIEEGKLPGFEDKKPIRSYKELEHVLGAKEKLDKEAGAQEAIEALFQEMPLDGKLVLDYILNGGKNLKDEILRPLFEYKEVDALDITKDEGKERVVRQGLRDIVGMADEDIDAEIRLLKDTNNLDAKAQFFQAKLKDLRAKELEESQKRTAQRKQEEAKKAQQEHQLFLENVDRAFSKDNLAGIKIDRQTQRALKQGFFETYHSRRTGEPISKLQAAIEHHTYVEPNYDLLALAQWLLVDPQGFFKQMSFNSAKSVDEEYRKQALQVTSERSHYILKRPI